MWMLPKWNADKNVWEWSDFVHYVPGAGIVAKVPIKAGTMIPVFGRFIRFEAKHFIVNATTLLGVDEKTCMDGCASEDPKESVDSTLVSFHGLALWSSLRMASRDIPFGNVVCSVYDDWFENKRFEPFLVFLRDNPLLWHRMIQSIALEKMDGVGYHQVSMPVVTLMEDVDSGTPLCRIFGRHPYKHPLCYFYFSSKDKREDVSPVAESQSLVFFLSELVKKVGGQDIWQFLYKKLIVDHGLVMRCASVNELKSRAITAEWLKVMFPVLKTDACGSPVHLL